MKFWGDVINLLDARMETPTMYGWFHILFFVGCIAAGVWLCIKHKQADEKFVRKLLLGMWAKKLSDKKKKVCEVTL